MRGRGAISSHSYYYYRVDLCSFIHSSVCLSIFIFYFILETIDSNQVMRTLLQRERERESEKRITYSR